MPQLVRLAETIGAAFAGLCNEDGATAVEYSLMVAGISLICVAAMIFLGGTVQDMFEGISVQVAATTS